jgi:hypothetical protein
MGRLEDNWSQRKVRGIDPWIQSGRNGRARVNRPRAKHEHLLRWHVEAGVVEDHAAIRAPDGFPDQRGVS